MFQVKSILRLLVLIFERSIMREINKKLTFLKQNSDNIGFGFISGLLVVQSEPESE